MSLARIVILLIAVLATAINDPNKSKQIEDILFNEPENTVVSRIVDGDTVQLSTGEKLRYIGMDTPEHGECYFEEATKRNSELVLNKLAVLEKDKSDTDRYGRLLRYIYVDSKMINEVLVKEGFAKAKTYKPDTKYQERLKEAENYAKTNNLGLWKDCIN